jgi:hypothetical protein
MSKRSREALSNAVNLASVADIHNVDRDGPIRNVGNVIAAPVVQQTAQ